MVKKYRKKSECPEEVDLFITLTNMIPLEVKMPDIFKIVIRKNDFIKREFEKRAIENKLSVLHNVRNFPRLIIFYDYAFESAYNFEKTNPEKSPSLDFFTSNDWFKDNDLTLRRALIACLKKLPLDFFKAVAINMDMPQLTLSSLKNLDHTEIGKIVAIYDYVREIRTGMISLVTSLTSSREQPSVQRNYFPVSIPAKADIDEDGNLHLTGVAGQIGKFDHNRLRLCQMCRLVFWEKRSGSKTCGKKKCVDGFQNNLKKDKKSVRFNEMSKQE